jgi:beta-lactamase superfamily II metal-dependent hydrolase
LAGLSILAVLSWRSALQAPDGFLHMTVLPVSGPASSGDAVLIQTPEGRYVLVDGGPRASLLSDGLGRRLPWGSRRLDWLVVAAPFEGQVGALPVTLARFPPRQVLWAGPERGSRPARALSQALTEAGIPVVEAQAGQQLDLGGGASLWVLAVGPRGAVLLLTWDRFRALLPAGIDFETLEALEYGRSIGPLSALLLAEGGYAPLSPPEWLANLRPRVVLLSVAAEDRQGLPSPETMAALEGYPVLRTDRQGWIEVITDGEGLWVEVGRR